MKATVLWLFMVLILSTMPVEGVELDIPSPDKIAHVILYAITELLFYVEMKQRRGIQRFGFAMVLFYSSFLATGYGVLMEVVQYFVPGRSLSYWDMAFNAVGAGLAALFLYYKEGARVRAVSSGS